MQAFEAIFHFNDQAFCGFFTDTRQFHQRGGFLALNGIHKLLSRHPGEDRQREFRPDAVRFDQFFKQGSLLFIVKPIQQLRIFTHHKLGEYGRFFSRFRELIKTGHRHMDFIAYAAHLK